MLKGIHKFLQPNMFCMTAVKGYLVNQNSQGTPFQLYRAPPFLIVRRQI